MSDKILEARIKVLDTQLANAVVEQIGDKTDDASSFDLGTYSVFVPGAVREWNQVKADSEAEAVEKVRAVLISKLEQLESDPNKKADVEIEPENVTINTAARETE